MSEYILKYECQKQFTTKKEMDDYIRKEHIEILSARKHCNHHYTEGKIISFKSNSVRVMFK